MSDLLYIRINWARLDAENAKGYTDWAVAHIMLGGEPVASRACAEEGVYATEGVAMRTAISLAKNDFIMHSMGDFRFAENYIAPEVVAKGIEPRRINGAVPASTTPAT